MLSGPDASRGQEDGLSELLLILLLHMGCGPA